MDSNEGVRQLSWFTAPNLTLPQHFPHNCLQPHRKKKKNTKNRGDCFPYKYRKNSKTFKNQNKSGSTDTLTGQRWHSAMKTHLNFINTQIMSGDTTTLTNLKITSTTTKHSSVVHSFGAIHYHGSISILFFFFFFFFWRRKNDPTKTNLCYV